MSYFFSWIKEGQIFDNDNIKKEKSHIFSFALTQREGEAALLNLVINQYKSSPQRQLFFWWENSKNSKERQLLFHGSLTNIPFQNQEGLWKLDFISHIDKKSLELLCAANSTHRNMENLFFPEKKSSTSFLESTPSLIEFNRTDGKALLSPITKGPHVHLLPNIFKKNHTIKVTHQPVEAVAVDIDATWIQKDLGEVDISSSLAHAFSKGMINTYSGNHFQASFPKLGDKIGAKRGRSGCRLIESIIERIDPPKTGVLDVYPRVSPTFPQKNKHGDIQDVQIERSWFKAALFIEWCYEQKRKENFRFTLSHTKKIHPHIKKMKFSLTSLPEKTGGSFFKSEMGLQTAHYALLLAKTYLQASKRCVEITCEIPIKDGFSITTHSVIDIACLLKKGTPIFAKVIEYKLIQNGSLGVCKIRAALSLSEIFSDEKREEDFVEIHDFFTPLQNIAPRGILDTQSLHTLDLVKNITVKNPPEWQEEIMTNASSHENFDVLDALKKHPTSFEITLQDLRTESVLEETIDLGTLYIKSQPLFIAGDDEDAY